MANDSFAAQSGASQPSTAAANDSPGKRVRRAIAKGDFAQAEQIAGQALQDGATSPILRRLWIQATNSQRDKQPIALERARDAIQRHPEDPALHQQYAQLLTNAGRPEPALECTETALMTNPNHIGLQCLRIKLLSQTGCLRQALNALRQLRRHRFDNLSVLLAAARFYQSHGRRRAALAVAERMLAIDPEHQKAQALKHQLTQGIAVAQVRRAMAKSDLPLAERLAGQALDDGATSPILRRLWIQATHQQGKLPIALERACDATRRHPARQHPSNPSLHQQYAQLLSHAGLSEQAMACISEALAEAPEHSGLRLQRFHLLRDAGHTRQALDALRQLRRHDFERPAVLLTAARFYRNHGRRRAALAVVERLLALEPEHRQARLLRLNLLYETATEQESAPLLSELLENARHKPSLTPDDAAELLQAMKFTTGAAAIAACQDALALLQPLTEALSEVDQLALLTQAERFGDHETAYRALSAILAAGPQKPVVARTLFTKAMETLGNDQADPLAKRLLRHIPLHQQASLKGQFAQHTEGAEAALDLYRAAPTPRRTLPQARELANLLRNARHYRLGLRYLRLCRRRWPQDAGLPLAHARLLLDAGFPDEALAILEAPTPVAQRTQALRLRAQILLEKGRLEETAAALAKIRGRIHTSGLLDLYLRVLILQEQEDAATELIRETQQRGQHKSIASGHFSPTVVGNLMADLALLKQERHALPPGDYEATLAVRYTNAASPVIRHHLDLSPDMTGPSPIPRQIFQYWDNPTPPEAVLDIMRSWRDQPGFDYRRFDHGEARAFLHDTFGATFARAFRQASNVAEASDLLRLCYLRHYGGLYADADDRLAGRLESLLPGDADLVCFREPFDILGNNVIACVPGHPAITLASELAAESILAQDNEITWSKTGPGLLTRAVARHLLSGNQTTPGQRVAILPGYLLRRDIQIHIPLPHKKTRQYWNAASRTGHFDISPHLVSTE
ncbi:glycosyltransferase [Halomonas piscis]|uniref:glycosyltransferase n=1 Tax=Halomonas piscis TaxID=3031727 RepID=UPI00289F8DD6|nr:glycosyltransferase [Halomonas piscis]